MASISQYWVWILVAVVGYFFLTRMAGCGGGHFMSRGSGNETPSSDQGGSPRMAVDPVSHHHVGGTTISAVYDGRAYYFESRENRDAFEHNPDKYLATAPSAGQAIGAEGNAGEQHRHRHGC
jgi:YHS domain-containing protein